MITREVKGKNPSDHHDVNTNTPKTDPSSSTNATTSWTRLKDPRIVRVSRAFGGKDRHSKVCTVRGLRDRRVRLSVPTAIQLYDLQDRLGLNQPSKVVDWLLNAAKDEIDELPPLQIPPHQGNFSNPNLYPMLGVGSSTSQVNTSNKEGLKSNWDVTLEPSNKEGLNAIPYNSNFLKWDPSNLSLAHSGSSHTHHGANSVHQQEDVHNFNVLAFPTTMSMPMLGNSQVFVYPQGLPQSFFHSHNINAGAPPSDFDPKEINFPMLSSSTSENPLSNSNSFRHSIESSTSHSHVRPFYFLPSQNSDGRESNKDREFQSN